MLRAVARLSIVVLLAGPVVALTASPCGACNCTPRTSTQLFRRADAAFVGSAIGQDAINEVTTVQTFSVRSVSKGELGATVPVIQPIVDSISGFIAVIPAEPSAELELLAADATKAFDSFRAPLGPEDRARRNPAALTPRQRDYLDRWGYPYVFEEFRFHMTLTGRLPAERREQVVAMLRSRFAATGIGPLAIDAIALCRQETPDSRFRVISRWPLQG